ncbi:MAG TPA: GDCCVxC domain-containing (seleno)protein [Gemmatimonadales bacterium]|nr:GDCCVxC domain-containing (seleno)protein [Gemmatimonadales bacterium]
MQAGVITCPECGTRSSEPMPENACMRFFECPSCRVLLRPRAGDCCVFCSYGDTPCPPVAVNGQQSTVDR